MTWSSNARRWLAVAGVLASSGSFAAPARAADDETQASSDPAQEARQQYQAGMQAYQAKRFVEAALHFEAAAAQKPHAVTLYTAALAWEQANRPERAADDFVRALAVPGLGASQAQNARDRLASLEKTMGTLDVTARDAAAWHVQVDSNTEVQTPAHLHALPGVHSLAAQGPSGPIQHQDVTLEAGKVAHVELALAAPPAPPAPSAQASTADEEVASAPAPATHAIDLRRMIGVGVAGIGIGSLAAGAILGVNALSARDAYDAAPSRAGFDHASHLATWTDVTLIAGGVLVAGGVALVLWPSPKETARPHDALADARVEKRAPAIALVPAWNGAIVRGVF